MGFIAPGHGLRWAKKPAKLRPKSVNRSQKGSLQNLPQEVLLELLTHLDLNLKLPLANRYFRQLLSVASVHENKPWLEKLLTRFVEGIDPGTTALVKRVEKAFCAIPEKARKLWVPECVQVSRLFKQERAVDAAILRSCFFSHKTVPVLAKLASRAYDASTEPQERERRTDFLKATLEYLEGVAAMAENSDVECAIVEKEVEKPAFKYAPTVPVWMYGDTPEKVQMVVAMHTHFGMSVTEYPEFVSAVVKCGQDPASVAPPVLESHQFEKLLHIVAANRSHAIFPTLCELAVRAMPEKPEGGDIWRLMKEIQHLGLVERFLDLGGVI